jgi:P4 family phage/plasmid primase-like protien
MSSMAATSILPGEINLSLIPVDWPLTPISDRKNPYLQGWQNKPQTVDDIRKELEQGRAKAVGLISGPVYNEPYGLIWVDVDGPTVYDTIKKESRLSIDDALPQTLTICSGREGRERKLYKVPKSDWKHLLRHKYVWRNNESGEKLEVMWKDHQGVLMGFHPDTDGYYTKENEDFRFATDLPLLPEWILDSIKIKNRKMGKPQETVSRSYGANFAINSKLSLDRTIQEAKEAMWALPAEAADDYDVWITIGQSLHSVDDTLLEEWDEWSKQSDKYKEGECLKRWQSFTQGGGIGVGTLFHHAKEAGWQPNQDYKVQTTSDEELDIQAQLISTILGDLGVNAMVSPSKTKKDTEKFAFGSHADVNTNSKKNRPVNEIHDMFMAYYAGNVRFSPALNRYLVYEHERIKGLWSPLSEHQMKQYIYSTLSEMKEVFLPNGFGFDLVETLYKNMQASLIQDQWNVAPEVLLFKNGAINTNNNELMEPTRDMYINRCLPYDYDKDATCEKVVTWLGFTQFDDYQRVRLLQAWLRAVLTGAYHLHKFVEIVGPGKSGKSSFANLCHALVGYENATVSQLEHLEKSKFECASLVDNKLVLFNDVERYGGNVANLKAITGGDMIRSEHKYKTEGQSFRFEGMVMITANEQIATTDATSGLARRRLTIPFDRPFRGTAREQKILIEARKDGAYGEFAPEIPGVISWVLSMTEQEMEDYLIHTHEHVDYYKKQNAQQMTRANPIIDWLHHNIIFVPYNDVYVGQAKPAAKDSSTFYAFADRRLYANYCEYCRNNNVGAQSRSRFESNIMDILNHQLNINVRKNPGRQVSIKNMMIRPPHTTNDVNLHQYTDYPSIVEVSQDPNAQLYRELYGDFDLRFR